MEISQEFSDFLWEWSREIANVELREIWAATTQHDKFFEVDAESNSL